jgi:hypothetical protein
MFSTTSCLRLEIWTRSSNNNVRLAGGSARTITTFGLSPATRRSTFSTSQSPPQSWLACLTLNCSPTRTSMRGSNWRAPPSRRCCRVVASATLAYLAYLAGRCGDGLLSLGIIGRRPQEEGEPTDDRPPDCREVQQRSARMNGRSSCRNSSRLYCSISIKYKSKYSVV